MKIANAIWATFLLALEAALYFLVAATLSVGAIAAMMWALNIPLYHTSPACELLESEEGNFNCKPAPKAPAPSNKALKKAQEKTEDRLAK